MKSVLNIPWKYYCWSSNIWCKAMTDWKRPDAETEWSQRRRERQRMRWLDSITDSMDMNLSKFWDIAENRGASSALIHGVAKNRTRLSNWMTTRAMHILYNYGLAVLRVCMCVRVCVLSSSVVSDSLWPWAAACQASLSQYLPEFAQVHVHWVSDAI